MGGRTRNLGIPVERPVVRFSGTGAALPLPPEQKVLRGHTLRTRGAKGEHRQLPAFGF